MTEIISEKQATVFSAGFCPYCTKAKKLLDKNDVEYSEVMLDEIARPPTNELLEKLVFGEAQEEYFSTVPPTKVPMEKSL